MDDKTGFSQRGSSLGLKQGSAAYVYVIVVDGLVRYIGKGRNGRMYIHLVEAKRSAARRNGNTAGLYPRMHRKLVEAIRGGCQISETIITSGLTDGAAYRLEAMMIGAFHRWRTGQLWNTIDERFIDPQFLPDEWDDPEHPAYKLPRPLVDTRVVRGRARSKACRPARPRGTAWVAKAGVLLGRGIRSAGMRDQAAAERTAI